MDFVLFAQIRIYSTNQADFDYFLLSFQKIKIVQNYNLVYIKYPLIRPIQQNQTNHTLLLKFHNTYDTKQSKLLRKQGYICLIQENSR